MNRAHGVRRDDKDRRVSGVSAGARDRRAWSESDVVRVTVCSVISIAAMVGTVMWAHSTNQANADNPINLLVVGYVTLGPLYTVLYVTWSSLVYRRQTDESLRELIQADDRVTEKGVGRFLGHGITNLSIGAAMVAVVVTIISATQSGFRHETGYMLMALITVACSWLLLVFAFAQTYMMLYYKDGTPDMQFSLDGPPRFSEFITLSLMISTMGAAAPATFTSQRAWAYVRTNVIMAFLFNTVILAMMVSLLFADLTR